MLVPCWFVCCGLCCCLLCYYGGLRCVLCFGGLRARMFALACYVDIRLGVACMFAFAFGCVAV